MLRSVSDHTIVLAAVWCLVGYACGFVCALTVFWRRITKPADDTVRMLELSVEDWRARADTLTRECAEKQRTIDQQTQQIGQLYRDVDRMARLAVEYAAPKRSA